MFSSEPIYWFIENENIMVLSRINDPVYSGAWYGFVNYMRPSYPSKFESMSLKDSVRIAQEAGIKVNKTNTLIKALRRVRAVSKTDLKIYRKMWFLAVILMIAIGVLAGFLASLPIYLFVPLVFVWLAVVLFLADIIVKWIITSV